VLQCTESPISEWSYIYSILYGCFHVDVPRFAFVATLCKLWQASRDAAEASVVDEETRDQMSMW